MKARQFARLGTGIEITEGGTAALCKANRSSYPTVFANTAWVQYEADPAAAKETQARPGQNVTTASQLHLAHFLVDCEPNTYFSISVSSVRTTTARIDCPLHFIISYFNDGDLHSYGSRAKYRDGKRDEARFAKGDIISAQVGIYESCKAKNGPKPPEWERVMEAKNMRSRAYDQSLVSRARFPRYPYVIFYKNYKMVHEPIIFPDVEEWPLHVGVFMARQGERVKLLPTPDGSGGSPVFKPLLPYPPERKSMEEEEREIEERLAREKRESELWERHRWFDERQQEAKMKQKKKETKLAEQAEAEKAKQKKKEKKQAGQAEAEKAKQKKQGGQVGGEESRGKKHSSIRLWRL